jgi:hypothetical protein
MHIGESNRDWRLGAVNRKFSLWRQSPRSSAPEGPRHNWTAILLFSALLLIPCYWQTRIQSADLSSHIYNAWLTSQVRRGGIPGLWISSQRNNILFDLMLEWLLVHVGVNLAQRLAVSIAVLIFGWGAIRFIFRIAGYHWWIAPWVAMLAYGFVYHLGLFNFYLSMGLCLWYLAFFWGGTWRIRALAAPFLALAWIAHPFPVVWAVCTAAYISIASAVQLRRQLPLLLLGLTVVVTARLFLTHRYAYSWSLNQVSLITGANQMVLFGLKYLPPLVGLLLIAMVLLDVLIKRFGLAGLIQTIPIQLWLLNAAAVLLIPDRVLLPQFGRPLGYIAQRLSLAAGLMLCAALASAPAPKFAKLALVSVALLFFGLLYTDEHALNRMEDTLDTVVDQLPRGQRVVTLLPSQSLASLCLHHDLDRACIGRCWSYANYEPASRQFRLRALPSNGIVLDNDADVDAAAGGKYVVQPRDLPVFLVYPCGSEPQDTCSRPLLIGRTTGNPK